MRRPGIVLVLVVLALGGIAGAVHALPAASGAGASCSAAGPVQPAFLQPVPATTCSRSVVCPDGSRQSCTTSFTNDCGYYVDCTTHVRCGVTCVGMDYWCPGFDNRNCGCFSFQ